MAELVSRENAVLDLGGGVVEKEENRKLIRDHCRVVWLKARAQVLMDRIKDSSHRPSLTGKSLVDEVPEVLTRREPFYQALSHLTLDTGKMSPEQAVEEIIQRLGLSGPSS